MKVYSIVTNEIVAVISGFETKRSVRVHLSIPSTGERTPHHST